MNRITQGMVKETYETIGYTFEEYVWLDKKKKKCNPLVAASVSKRVATLDELEGMEAGSIYNIIRTMAGKLNTSEVERLQQRRSVP